MSGYTNTLLAITLWTVAGALLAWPARDFYRQRWQASLSKAATVDEWLPVWEAVKYVANAIGDHDEQTCWPSSRNVIRQMASDGRVVLRGRKQIPLTNYRMDGAYSSIITDIPPSYWRDSALNAYATSAKMSGLEHTQPEHAYSWEGGPASPNYYTSVVVNKLELERALSEK